MMYYIVFFALIAAASATPCPEVTPIDNFNFSSYGQGTWYEVARYPAAAEVGADCGSAEYKLEGDVIKVKNYYVKDNQARVIEGTAKLAPDAGNTGKVIHTLPYGAGGALTDSLLNILAINYDKFLVGYYCKFDEAKDSHQDFAWVLSRTKTLDADSKSVVDKIIQDSKVLEADKFIWPSFSDEACKVNA